MVLFHIRIFPCHLYYTSACELQVHVWHVCHMWIAQWIKWVNKYGPLQPWIQHSFWHENLCIRSYQDNSLISFIYKNSLLYSKDSQIIEVF